MSEPKFTKGPWKRTYTTIPHVVEGYDVSPDIVNVTIEDRNIPLAAWCMNSTAEGKEYYHTMEANASLMAASPELYASEEKNLEFLKLTLSSYKELAKLAKNDDDVKAAIQAYPQVEIKDIELIIQQLEQRILETEQLLKKARGEK